MKKREVFFRIASDFDTFAGILPQPNGEVLRKLAQAHLDFATTASTELINATLDHMVCYLSDYVSLVTTQISVEDLNEQK